MKLDLDAFPTKYTTMQARFIYVVFSRYESFTQIATLFKVTRKYIHHLLTVGELPIEYAFVMAEKWNCRIGLFNYYLYCIVFEGDCLTYSELVDICPLSLTTKELQYIKNGTAMLSPRTILRNVRKKVLKND